MCHQSDQWLEDRIHFMAGIFGIDVCAYAVMSNHTHLVLHIHQAKSRGWSSQEVIQRWHRLHKGTLPIIETPTITVLWYSFQTPVFPARWM